MRQKAGEEPGNKAITYNIRPSPFVIIPIKPY